MTSQYDDIGANYNIFKQFPASIVETHNFRKAVKPYLEKAHVAARVLDLACGTGYYSHKLLDWGAGHVHGIDISASMVAAARQTITPDQKSTGVLKFDTGNATSLGRLDGQEFFDIATGVWLLNYATSLADMTAMFRSISANLKPGGVFVGVTPYPTEDIKAFAGKTEEVQQALGTRWGAHVNYFEELDSGEGWRTEVIGQREPPVVFRNYHLRKSLYEQAARDGGMSGRLVWKDIELPREAIDKSRPGFWDMYYTHGPHMGLMIVEK